jgi:hypothetical protein
LGDPNLYEKKKNLNTHRYTFQSNKQHTQIRISKQQAGQMWNDFDWLLLPPEQNESGSVDEWLNSNAVFQFDVLEDETNEKRKDKDEGGPSDRSDRKDNDDDLFLSAFDIEQAVQLQQLFFNQAQTANQGSSSSAPSSSEAVAPNPTSNAIHESLLEALLQPTPPSLSTQATAQASSSTAIFSSPSSSSALPALQQTTLPTVMPSITQPATISNMTSQLASQLPMPIAHISAMQASVPPKSIQPPQSIQPLRPVSIAPAATLTSSAKTLLPKPILPSPAAPVAPIALSTESLTSQNSFFHTVKNSPNVLNATTALSTTGTVISNPHEKETEELDKRRRNTAASARFRARKKQREQALESTAKEMMCKTEILEKRIKGELPCRAFAVKPINLVYWQTSNNFSILTEYEMEIKWLRQLVTERNNAKTLREIYQEVGILKSIHAVVNFSV